MDRVVMVMIALLLIVVSARAADLETVRLWEGDAPQAKGTAETDIPIMYVYRPAPERSNGAAVIVAPGGGYSVHAIDHEGVQVAHWLNELGVTAFVLKYRLRPDGYNEAVSFLDGQRAIRYLRHHAARFGIDGDRIGFLGFSAGGHLATAVALEYDSGRSDSDAVDRASSRPDFGIICYTTPAPFDDNPNRGHGRKLVTAQTPPMFHWLTAGDAQRVKPTCDFYSELIARGVEAELHIFGGWGPHGLGLAPGDPAVSTWPDLAGRWMRKIGLLTAKPRVAVAGRVTIGGKPLHRGWVRFTPVGDPHAPIVGDYITHRDDGRYTIEAAHGLVPGEYTVDVWLVAKEFLKSPSMGDAEHYPAKGKSPLRVKVTESGGTFDFALE